MGCCQSKHPETEPLLAGKAAPAAPKIAPASTTAAYQHHDHHHDDHEKVEPAPVATPVAPAAAAATPAPVAAVASSPAAASTPPKPAIVATPPPNPFEEEEKEQQEQQQHEEEAAQAKDKKPELTVNTSGKVGAEDVPTIVADDNLVPYVKDIGEIRLSFQYMNSEQCLILTIHEARKVDPKHSFIYARANLITDEDLNVEKFKTTTKSVKEPIFEDIFTFNRIERPELAKYSLAVVLFESHPLGDKVIGEFRFALSKLNAEHGLPRYYPLKMYKDRPKSMSENLAAKFMQVPNELGLSFLNDSSSAPSSPSVEKEKKSLRSLKKQHQGSETASISSVGSRHEDLGELTVKVAYSSKAKRLTVTVLEINEPEFRAHPEHQTVYINATLPEHKQKQKSKTYPRRDKITLEEVFVFDIAPEELADKPVDLALKVSSNSFIGLATIDLKNREGDFEFDCVYSLEARSFMKALSSLSNVNLFRRNSTSSINSKKGEDEVANKESFGEINVGISVILHEKKVKITIIEGRGLKSCDSNGFSDPYVEVRLVPEEIQGKKKKKEEFKTKVVKKNLNPRFDETFEFPMTAAELSTKKVQLVVWDHDSVGRDFMGETFIDLSTISLDQLHKQWCTLGKKTTGEMKVRFVVNENETTLEVTIISAKDLIPLRSSGHIDAYVKVYLQPDKKKLTKRKTSTKKQVTTEAKWDEKVSYNLRDIDDHDQRSIVVTVHDEDKLKNNPEVGEFSIPLKEVLTEKKVVGWYTLSR